MIASNFKVSVVRCEHFNAAHRLHNPRWNDQQNQEVFGKCNNPNYHGHNYELEVKVTGEVDPETGYVIDTKKLSNLIQKEVTDVFDHKNLNLDVPHFKNVIPSTENIAKITYDILRPLLDEKLELKIKLYETPRNYVEYPG